MQKESAAAQEEMRRIREQIDRNEERFRQLSDKVDKNKMADAGMVAELQGLQAGEERRGSNASQAVDCSMETNGGTVLRYGSGSEDEQDQDKASQQLALSASSGSNEGTPASSSQLDLPRVRGALGECGGAGKSGAAKDPMEEDASLGDLNSQGEDPRTFKEPVQRWQFQKKREEKKWKKKKKQKDKKKKVKYRRISWWKKAKEKIASLLAAMVNN